jgi:hypothetical protein
VKANILDALPTAFDLLALVISLGALGCRLGILPAVEAVSGAVGMEAILRPLWRLLVICLTALTVSSLAELVGRAVEMSGLPLPDVLPLLPTILFHTHYGRVWLLRPLALTGLWARWCLGRRHRQSRLIPRSRLGRPVVRRAHGLAAHHGERLVGGRADHAVRSDAPASGEAPATATVDRRDRPAILHSGRGGAGRGAPYRPV